MPFFTYEAKDGPSRKIRGTVEAPNKSAAIEKVHEMGCVPVKIEEYTPNKASAAPAAALVKSGRAVFPAPINPRDVTIFTQQLASLLKSGVPIIRGIRIIAEQAESAHLGSVLTKIANDVSEGGAFSDAVKKYPRLFPRLYVSMAAAGENSGKLYEVLYKIAGYRRKTEESLAKMKTALVYPALMGLVGLGTIIFMLVFVLPRISKLFASLGQALPIPTKIVIGASSFLRNEWYWVLTGILIGMIISRQFAKTKLKKRVVSFLGMHTPVLKNFIITVEFSRFSRTMELLIKSGIPILRTLELAIPTVENVIIRKELASCYKSVSEGGSLGKELQNKKIFPPFMSSMIKVAEESGRLDEVFEEIADIYERETDEALKVMMSFLEPVMILVMGLVVGFVVISMLLPIFEISFMER